MSLILVAALTVSGPVLPACSWDRPGANSFQGDVVAAVDRYQDIPEQVRATLKKRMQERKYDEIATIKRDDIVGAHRYTDLRDMHFGKGQICNTVTRKWKPNVQERGLVYCEEGHCIIVPTVCRNVSRITRVPMQKAQAEDPAAGGEGDTAPVMVAGLPPGNGELQFEAPAAGASPSFQNGLSGSSPVLPGGSESGLAGGGPDFHEPISGAHWPWAGLPFITAAAPSGPGAGGLPGGLPIQPPSAGGGDLPAVPGVPGPGGPTILPPISGGDVPVTPGGPGPVNPPVVPPVTGGGDVPVVPGIPGPGVATPIPEPSTWAMLGVGLGLLALVGRRRAKAARR